MVDDIRGAKPRGSGRPNEAFISRRGSPSIPTTKSEPDFEPPEEVARQEELIDMANQLETPQTMNKLNPTKNLKIKNPFPPLKAWWNRLSKKQKIIAAASLILVLSLLSYGGYKLVNKPAPVKPVVVKKQAVKPPPKPTTEPSKLTGVTVPIEANLLPVTGIMIENSPDARPQSGLIDAGVVFEAVAEGGITRFLALYQESQPDYIGPVRSVRPYYLQWLQGFDAAVAHVGGSGEALAKIQNEGIKDLDQSHNSGSFHRIAQRYAPHNVYTSMAELLALTKARGYGPSNFTGFARKAEKAVTPPTARSIDFDISGPLYNAHYDYDPASNTYVRYNGGALHKDERSGQQITPKVVIALVMPKGIDPDGIHTTYNTFGSGTAFIFQDGIVTQGNWSKASDKDQFRFVDAAGSPLGLNPGQTWISIVGDAASVKFAP